jgi:hypothetical protein
LARYDKIHLFRFDNGREQYDESRVIERGGSPQAFELPSRDGHRWRVGLSVCYDLRFGELYRALAADVLLVPSAFTFVTGQAHWETLLRARAIENLAYVAAPAQGGVHENGRQTWGHSMVVGPLGCRAGRKGRGRGCGAGRPRLAALPVGPYPVAGTGAPGSVSTEAPRWVRPRSAQLRWSLWSLLVALIVALLACSCGWRGGMKAARFKACWSAMRPRP